MRLFLRSCPFQQAPGLPFPRRAARVNGFRRSSPATRPSISSKRHPYSLRSYTAGSFGDVTAGQYYAAYAEWAKENGIVNGVGGGNFAPGAEITRQDLAVLLSRYAEFAGEQFPVTLQYATFADDDLIADYARIAVERLYCGGIVSGKPDNAFDPRGNATRAEVAAMLQRFELNLS